MYNDQASKRILLQKKLLREYLPTPTRIDKMVGEMLRYRTVKEGSVYFNNIVCN